MHLFVDNLTNVDFSYLHPKRGLVGETWLASVTLEGGLDEQGMICDFGTVKKTLRQWLDNTIDHCLLVPEKAEALQYSTTEEQLSLAWQYGNGDLLRCQSPIQAITLIEDTTIDPDTVAKWCIQQLKSLLPDTVERIRLRFEPEVIIGDYYHYSHGLKKHQGNCQRIAHGHRSTIEIYQNDVRSPELETQWCQRWRDIYIGTKDDCAKVFEENGRIYCHFTYQAPQGNFELTIAEEKCELIETDTTVEHIAQYIADTLKMQHPQSTICVKAFEGYRKGAIAFA